MLKKVLTIFLFMVSILYSSDTIVINNNNKNHICESTRQCPLILSFKDGIGNGDKIIVKENNVKIFELINNSTKIIKNIKAHIRTINFDSNHITVSLIKKHGKTSSSTQTIRSLGYNGAEIPLRGEPTDKVILRQKGKRILFRIINKMARTNYIDTIQLHSLSGDIIIKTTPLMSELFYFKINTKNNIDKVNITTHIADKPYSNNLKYEEIEKGMTFASESEEVKKIYFDIINTHSKRSDIFKLIKHNKKIFKYLPKKYRKDKQIALATISQNIETFKYVDETLKKDKQFLLNALNENPRMMNYLDSNTKEYIFHHLTLTTIDGKTYKFSNSTNGLNMPKDFKNKVVIIVFVYQGIINYDDFIDLIKKYKGKLEILAIFIDYDHTSDKKSVQTKLSKYAKMKGINFKIFSTYKNYAFLFNIGIHAKLKNLYFPEVTPYYLFFNRNGNIISIKEGIQFQQSLEKIIKYGLK